MMVLAEALIRLLELWDQDQMEELPDALLQDRLPITLIQILNRTLMGPRLAELEQSDQSIETLAYAVLTLKALSSLPWLSDLSEEILSQIMQWQHLLHTRGKRWIVPQSLWVEKVTYGSTFLCEAYYLAAIFKGMPTRAWTGKVKSLVQIRSKDEKRITSMFCKLQCFQSEPAWKIHACVLEALVFLPQLRSSLADVLGGEQSAKNEYLSFIPCTWVVVNNIQRLFLDTYLLWDMMVLTLCNFRVDEFMETTMAQLSEPDLQEAKFVIQTLCKEWATEKHASCNKATASAVPHSIATCASPPAHRETPTSPSTSPFILTDIRAALSPYVDVILGHPHIACVSKENHSALSTALSTFLTSHIDQLLTNALVSTQNRHPFLSFTHWLHTIAAPSVSAPFSFTFLTCLIGGLPTSTTRYMGIDFGTRVAMMSRMYNDLGSLARDRAEGNVNCADFAELNDGQSSAGDEQIVKGRLEELARYERDGAHWVGTRLVSALKGGKKEDRTRKADAVTLFLGVAELYADLYLVRDLSNQLKNGEH